MSQISLFTYKVCHLNKKLLIILFVFCFLISFVSASWNTSCSNTTSDYLFIEKCDNPISTGNWTLVQIAGTVTCDNGNLTVANGGNTATNNEIKAIANFSNTTGTYTVEFVGLQFTITTSNRYWAVGQDYYAINSSSRQMISDASGSGIWNGIASTYPVAAAANTRVNWTVVVNGSNISYYINNVFNQMDSKQPVPTNQLFLGVRDQTNNILKVDTIVVYDGNSGCPAPPTVTGQFSNPTPATGTHNNTKNIILNLTCSAANATVVWLNRTYRTDCYQEFANVSTDCGGLSSGAYDARVWENNNSILDGNWNTFSAAVLNKQSTLMINYTIPSGATNASWIIKFDASGNISRPIPQSCINSTIRDTVGKLQLKVSSNRETLDNITFICFGLNNASYAVWNDSTKVDLYEEGIFWNITTPTLGNTSNQLFNISDYVTEEGIYAYYGICNNTAANTSFQTATRTWIYDTTTPTAQINSDNFFNSLNTTNVTRVQVNKNISMNFSDNIQLFAYEINITNGTHTFFYNYSITLSGLTYNLSNLFVNFSNWTFGTYYVQLAVSDSHTANEIKEYDTTIQTSKVKYKTTEKNEIEIRSLDTTSVVSTKEKDKYSFEFNYATKIWSVKSFILSSKYPIVYLPASKYKAHFVIISEGVKGNWIDFEGKYSPIVERLNDYEYKISIETDDKKVKFDSIGGLNTLSKTYSFLLKSFYPYNLQVYYSDIKIRNFTTEFINATLSNETVINNFLRDGCTCLNCTIIGGICRIPITFFSDVESIMNISIFNISYAFEINNCSGSSIPSNGTALNVSIIDEFDSKTAVIYAASTTYNATNFSLQVFTQNVSYCVYPSWLNISTETQFEYQSGGNYYSYYYDAYFNNITKTLTLRLQQNTSQVTFSVYDIDGNALADYRIQILKFDVGKGSYYLQEILKTDSKGNAIGNIELYNAFYNFLIYDDSGTLVLTQTGIRLVSTTYIFTVSGTTDAFYQAVDTTMGINWNAYYNNDTKFAIFTWSDPSGLMHQGCLKIEERNHSGITLIDDTCVTSAASTLTYLIPIGEYNETRETKYIATAYFKFDYEFLAEVMEIATEGISNFFVADRFGSLFIAFVLILIGIMIGLPNPNISMVYFFAVLIVTFWLKLWYISVPVLGSIIILGVFILYTGGKQQ